MNVNIEYNEQILSVDIVVYCINNTREIIAQTVFIIFDCVSVI